MHILILGSGVIGTASAWYLAKAGHQVTVVDRQEAVALETSRNNAGMISPGYSSPWAAPGVPIKAIKWLMQDLAPLRINFRELDMNTLSWMGKMLANCNTKSYQINKERMMRLAQYSHSCFIDMRKSLDIQYDQRQQGTLQIFRTHKQMQGMEKDLKVLDECNVPYQQLTVEQCLQYEPALKHVQDKFVGGLRLPLDETGDCFKFTTALAKECEKLGVKFLMNTQVTKLTTDNNSISAVITDRGELKADQYLVAMGSYSPHLLKQVGIHIPVYPIKGYSLTIPVTDSDRAPVSTVMDETYKIAVTRFEDRIRIGGVAEIASYNLNLEQKCKANIEYVVNDLFPGAGDLQQGEFWTGLRPMTPDSTPVLGGTKYANLFINSGHGTLGWTMSLGSGKFIADIMSNNPTDINPDGLSIQRYCA